jgi:hypothetical protein
LDSVSVRVGKLVKDRRPPKAAALRAVLDNTINTNTRRPSDQGRPATTVKLLFLKVAFTASLEATTLRPL